MCIQCHQSNRIRSRTTSTGKSSHGGNTVASRGKRGKGVVGKRGGGEVAAAAVVAGHQLSSEQLLCLDKLWNVEHQEEQKKLFDFTRKRGFMVHST